MKLLPSVAFALSLLAPQSGDPQRVSFSVLAGFEYVEGMDLPASVTQYDEQRVVIAGFMQAENAGEEQAEQFLLINDACGCQGTPKLNEIVFCAMPEGSPARIRPGTVKVTGTLYVGEETEDSVVLGVYFLDVDTIE